MYYGYQNSYYEQQERNLLGHIRRTYGMMAAGLTLTFAVALLTAYFLPRLVFSFPLAVILLLAQVICVIAFGSMLHRASYGAVVGMYLAYATLTGVSISYIFALYSMQTIFLCFAAAALSFGILALLGHSTRRDLSGYGRFFLVGLIGLLLISVVGFFIGSTVLELVICCLGLVLFLGITAYDTQKLRRHFESGYTQGELAKKASVYFAMQLYLDFINIFLYIVRLFGRSRD
ncbi:MAG: Bax inhibitor-1/YccA family protein [Clostridia bacterium]|nr:Bax inhibitor-1/YccA family protein [Clostridia bacterium]